MFPLNLYQRKFVLMFSSTISLKDIFYYFRRIVIKTGSWEYWPMWAVYFPVSFYYAYLSFKARSFFFFSASNPSIENGGMFFESKWKIFQLMPKEYYPATILIDPNDTISNITDKMKVAAIQYPVIAKPDRGERGWMVKKIHSPEEMEAYRNTVHISFLIQEYIDYPLEFSIFYYRHPNSNKGHISSVTYKQLLSITGDGISDMDTLIRKQDRSFLQYKRLKKELNINLDQVLDKGEEKLLVPYGNHVLGTRFVNCNHLIDQQLTDTFDTISKKMEGFYFGRFDLRCRSIGELKQNTHISILELNGAGAEPAHIYNPGFSFIEAQKVLASHYKMMFDAAIENKKKGFEFMCFRSFIQLKKEEKKYKQNLQLL